jgi:hypothetical protein
MSHATDPNARDYPIEPNATGLHDFVRIEPNTGTPALRLFCLLIGNNRIAVNKDFLALKTNDSTLFRIIFKKGLSLPPKGFFSFTFLEKYYFVTQEYNIHCSNVVYDILGHKSHEISHEERWIQLNPPTSTDAFALQLSICGFDQGKFIIDTLIVHILDPKISSYFIAKIS